MLPGELALSQVLIGDLPRPAYSRALREEASRRWREVARLTLDYAEGAYGRHREPVVATALVTQAVIQIAHARLAAHGTWVLNEKRIVRQAGLAHLGRPLPRPGGTADGVAEAIATARAQLS